MGSTLLKKFVSISFGYIVVSVLMILLSCLKCAMPFLLQDEPLKGIIFRCIIREYVLSYVNKLIFSDDDARPKGGDPGSWTPLIVCVSGCQAL